MKFVYQYRTSDNRLQRGVFAAASREAAFAALKEQGIKPAKLEVAPGFFNSLLAKGRWFVVAVILLAVAGIFAYLWLNSPDERPAQAVVRHQIYGDPEICGKFANGDFSSVNLDKLAVFLARYAQPGQLPRPRPSVPDISPAELNGLLVELPVEAADGREVSELKQIVNWMKAELREYLANGVGTLATYAERLEERSRYELQVYERTRLELEGVRDESVFEDRNMELRRLGLRTIEFPQDL